MSEKAKPQIRRALQQLDASIDLNLPTVEEVWSRSQFRLAYRRRRCNSTSHTEMLFAAFYVLAVMLWTAWAGWFSIGLLAMVAFAAVAACVFMRHISGSFRS
jgi:hypothetical protein